MKIEQIPLEERFEKEANVSSESGENAGNTSNSYSRPANYSQGYVYSFKGRKMPKIPLNNRIYAAEHGSYCAFCNDIEAAAAIKKSAELPLMEICPDFVQAYPRELTKYMKIKIPETYGEAAYMIHDSWKEKAAEGKEFSFQYLGRFEFVLFCRLEKFVLKEMNRRQQKKDPNLKDDSEDINDLFPAFQIPLPLLIETVAQSGQNKKQENYSQSPNEKKMLLFLKNNPPVWNHAETFIDLQPEKTTHCCDLVSMVYSLEYYVDGKDISSIEERNQRLYDLLVLPFL